MDDCVNLLHLPTGSGERFLFKGYAIVSFVDCVIGQDVGCCKMWITWRQAGSTMTWLVHLINFNKANSAF